MGQEGPRMTDEAVSNTYLGSIDTGVKDRGRSSWAVTGKREGPVVSRERSGVQVKRLRGGSLTSRRDDSKRIELIV